MDQNEQKKIVGYRAAELIEPHMLVGIGTGSTVHYFIQKLIEKVKLGLKIEVVFSSKASQLEAAYGNILPIKDEMAKEIDITIDGTDEIDPSFCMIKGGGGALLREKILASSSKQTVIIADSSKYVQQLGKQKIPIEILPFCFKATIKKITTLGFNGLLRQNQDTSIYLTDNGNYIYDLYLVSPLTYPRNLHFSLIQIPGVIETGIFFDVATKLLICDEKGNIKELAP
ncbi:MAG: ribose 5-phosphate isomerase A [Chlamydiales bacterium]|nr:ribose 5-phosphate isomerase A [Chlamydiales bacterium]